ncbi:hypothetical protein EHM69_03430 [candidate division KSB1 bacterium]|nr:MAG: hypothetical protein EHM69_03430 [candidate division KSB1 bacterium]
MKISLNGHELSRTAEGDQTVEQVLMEVRSEIQAAGRVVTRVAVDGEPLSAGWQRRRHLGKPVSQIQQMDLVIEEPARLQHQTLRDAAELADRLVGQAKPLGRKFRVGDEVTANNELSALLDDLKLIVSGLDLTTRKSNENSLSPVRNRLMDTATRLLPTLDRIYKAQAQGDYIAIADELEYDLRDQMVEWKDLLSEVQRSLEPLPQD